MKHNVEDFSLYDLIIASESIYLTADKKAEITSELIRRSSVIDADKEVLRIHNLT